jgi:site-specific recombinase XerD
MDDRSNAEWMSRFEAHLKRRFHDRSTAKHYMSDLRLFAQFHPGPLDQVSTRDVDAFVDRQHDLGLAPATVKRRVAALKSFFDFVADELGRAGQPNPVSMRRHAGRQPKLLPRDLSDGEVARLLAVIGQPRDLAMVALMLYAGLRVGEVASLCPADLSADQGDTSPVRLRVMGKGRKERMVYLCRQGYDPLARYLAERPPASTGEPIFRNRLGGPITVAGIEERLGHYGRLCGVELTPHRLRHTYGRWMAESRLPVLSLAKLLGHSSLQATQRYVDGADPAVRRGYEAAMELHLAGAAVPVQTESPAPLRVEPGPTTVARRSPGSCPGEDWLSWAPDWLRQGCLAWLHHQWPRWKASQRRHHAQNRLLELRLFWSWQLGRRPLAGFEELTAADVAAFADAQLGQGLAAKTVKTRLDRVYELLRYLKDRGGLASLPDRPALKLPDPLPRHLEPGELLALEGWLERRRQEGGADGRLEMALYYLLGHAGLRISEALDLQVKDLDLASRRVRVRQGKGGRDRVVYLTAKAAEVLGEYLETVPHAPGDLLLSWRGRPLEPGQARRHLHRLGDAVGIADLSPHRLRHTYATVLLNNGMGIEGLRRLMGHENLNTTLIYARLADTTLERQYRAAMDQATARTESAGSANEQLSVTLDNSV